MLWKETRSPGALWEYRYSGTEASLEPKSCSWDTGDPSRDRHSGVWRPLEWGEKRPEWVGDAGALLKPTQLCVSHTPHRNSHKHCECYTYMFRCYSPSRVQKLLFCLKIASPAQVEQFEREHFPTLKWFIKCKMSVKFLRVKLSKHCTFCLRKVNNGLGILFGDNNFWQLCTALWGGAEIGYFFTCKLSAF